MERSKHEELDGTYFINGGREKLPTGATTHGSFLWYDTSYVLFADINEHYEVDRIMEQPTRVKKIYHVCICQVYKAACLEPNDHDNCFVRVKTNPWTKVKISKAARFEQRSISAEEYRKFFAAHCLKQDEIAFAGTGA